MVLLLQFTLLATYIFTCYIFMNLASSCIRNYACEDKKKLVFRYAGAFTVEGKWKTRGIERISHVGLIDFLPFAHRFSTGR